jgi:peptidoglycan/LPS O-acetylase OafA/YrhL
LIVSQSQDGQPPVRDSFAYFDVFRFVAAALVVISHARDLLLVDYGAAHAHGAAIKALYFITGLGHEAVVIFFVLSGFWIAGSIDRRRDDPKLWAHYAIDRGARLYIVLVPALLATLLWDSLGLHLLHSPLYNGDFGPNSLKMRVDEELGLVTLLGNLVFLQTIAVNTFGSNGPLWSLANEFWYYVAYPGLFLLARRRWSLFLLALPLVGLMPDLLSGFAVWLLGAALHFATRGAGAGLRFGRVALALSLGALAASLALSRGGVIGRAQADIVIGLSFTACLYALIRVKPRFQGLLAPLADFGAKASFSLYLCHYPFVAFLAAFLLRDGRMQPDARALALLGAVVAAALAYALAFAWASERHTPTVRRWLRARLG